MNQEDQTELRPILKMTALWIRSDDDCVYLSEEGHEEWVRITFDVLPLVREKLEDLEADYEKRRSKLKE